MGTKKPGRILLPIGWIFIALSVFILIGLLNLPHHRDRSIEALLNQQDGAAIAGTLGLLIGTNFIHLFPLFFGIYAAIRKNPQGKVLIVASAVLICIHSGFLFLPSSESEIINQSDSMTVKHPESEFIVTFPRIATKKIVTAGGQETVAYECKATESLPYLRAEFINRATTDLMRSNFRNILDYQAKLAGLSIPEITESRDNLGTIGTYSGIKKVGDIVTAKVYGKIVLSEYSGIHCLVVENLEVFPSEETTSFLVSIERK